MIILFDPSASGFNRGDAIIAEAVKREVVRAAPAEDVWSVSLHQQMSRIHRNRMREADIAVIAGSNMLDVNSKLFFGENRWVSKYSDANVLSDRVLLCGVGWSDKSRRSNFLGRRFYRRILCKDAIHSVRDSYTKNMMETLGWSNIINTSCPTLWDIDESILERIPKNAAKDVVTTLTDYREDLDKDRAMFEQLEKVYRYIYFWPQGSLDSSYLKKLGVSTTKVRPIGSDLSSYDKLLENEDSIDYVGTRLHGGIRALQKMRRTIIIGVDSRATSISKDTGLNVLDRGDIHGLSGMCGESLTMNIVTPKSEIMTWRQEFAKTLSSRL